MRDSKLFQFISRELVANRPVILLAVVHSDASSPGRVGFKMAVTAAGKRLGTIGGGKLEHDLVREAEALLNQRATLPRFFHRVHHPDRTGEQSGMICAGEQSVVLCPILPEQLTLIRDFHTGPTILQLSPAGLSKSNRLSDQKFVFRFQHENDWVYTENSSLVDTAYIIGSGHVGLALCRQLALLDFHVVALDQRPEVDSFVNNTFAHEKRVVDYHHITGHIESGDFSYVVIMTHTHQLDQVILAQLAPVTFRYLGMLGSRSKVHTVFEILRQKGIDEGLLKRVYTPIGLKIHSKTAAEIAVSIAAQIIQIKNEPGQLTGRQ